MREAFPEARASAIGQRRAFNLVGGRGGAPKEAVGKTVAAHDFKALDAATRLDVNDYIARISEYPPLVQPAGAWWAGFIPSTGFATRPGQEIHAWPVSASTSCARSIPMATLG